MPGLLDRIVFSAGTRSKLFAHDPPAMPTQIRRAHQRFHVCLAWTVLWTNESDIPSRARMGTTDRAQLTLLLRLVHVPQPGQGALPVWAQAPTRSTRACSAQALLPVRVRRWSLTLTLGIQYHLKHRHQLQIPQSPRQVRDPLHLYGRGTLQVDHRLIPASPRLHPASCGMLPPVEQPPRIYTLGPCSIPHP